MMKGPSAPSWKERPTRRGDGAATATRRKSRGARMKQMGQKKKAIQPSSKTLPKAATGIQGLDEITGGGLPRGRPTLISGGAGAGKTLFGLEFLVRGATQYSEPGVFMSFEESIPDLTKNVASLGFDLDRLVSDKKLFVDHVSIAPSELGETGEYDLEGLFIRIADAVQRGGARRVVLDTIEALFGDLPNPAILRSEIRRLFNWLKQKRLTTVITAERDHPDKLTRHGIEEFVSDCVILLDHRIREEISTRRLRIIKYRGSTHGTNEYPFLIDDQGISVLPISSLGLNHDAPAERVSSGIARLDGMLGGKGFYRGSSILASGTAGTGKTTIAACFVDAACRRGDRSPVFRFRRITPADRPQYAFDRHRPRAMGPQRAPAIPCGASHLRGNRTGPVTDPQTHHQLPAQRGCGGPGYQSAHGQHPERSAEHAHAAGRFSEDPGDHHDFHQFDCGGGLGSQRGGRLLPHGHLAPAEKHRGRGRAEPRALRAEIERHGAFQPDSRIRAHGRRPPIAGRLPGSRGRADRFRPDVAGNARESGGHVPPARTGDPPARTGAQAPDL